MKAYEILSSPDKWCKFHLAEDEHNHHLMPNEDRACKFCTIGAIIKAYPNVCERIAKLTQLR